jgi:hypothetical protein
MFRHDLRMATGGRRQRFIPPQRRHIRRLPRLIYRSEKFALSP